MVQAFGAADLAVCRSGASTLGELPAAGLPAVLVPGPFSDQERNARFLEERGAAVTLPNDQIDDLYPLVQRILSNPEGLAGMRRAMGALARPGAADELATLLREVAV